MTGAAIEALGSLNPLERRVTRRFVVRQIRRGGYFHRDMAKYGPAATIRICVARTYRLYMLGVGLLSIGFSIADLAVPALLTFGLVVALAVLGFLSLLLAKVHQDKSAPPPGTGSPHP